MEFISDLRLLVLCDKYGKKTEPSLQMRCAKIDVDNNITSNTLWRDIPYVEIKTENYTE